MSMEGKNKVNWLWVIPISLILPAYQLLVAFLQVGQIGPLLAASLIFLPAGLIEGIAFVWWSRDVKTAAQRRSITMGFVIGFMFAFFGSLLLPQIMPPWLGATLGGAVPWVTCTWIGYRREVHLG